MDSLPSAFKGAALLIVAHGSPGSSEGRTSTRKMAEKITAMDVFATVDAAFLAESPRASDVLDAITQRDIYIVPNLAADGFITREKLPRALKLTGRITQKGPQRILLSDPVGTHPMLTRILGDRIKNAMRENACEMNKTALVIIGHGSKKERESFTRTAQAANAMKAHGVTCPTFSAFLEEAPFVRNWRNLQDSQREILHINDVENVFFAPLLITDGFHGARDIPLAIGFNPAEEEFQKRLAADRVNVIAHGPQRLFYMPPVGNAPGMAKVILARAKQAFEAASHTPIKRKPNIRL